MLPLPGTDCAEDHRAACSSRRLSNAQRGGEVIYVGKAVNLAQRVRSYFQRSSQEQPKVRRLVGRSPTWSGSSPTPKSRRSSWRPTSIKRYRPRYNVRLKDDKRYPYLQITREPFPSRAHHAALRARREPLLRPLTPPPRRCGRHSTCCAISSPSAPAIAPITGQDPAPASTTI